VRAPIPANGVARINLSCVQATVLASRLVNTLDQNGQDPTEVLLPYDYGDKFSHIIAEGLGISQAVTAKGLGIHSGIHQCQNQGRGGQSQQLPDAQRPTNPPQAQVTAR
jgi:hypothetical protein